MRTTLWIVFVSASLWLAGGVMAQQPPGKSTASAQSKGTPTVASQPPFKAAATVKDIMAAMAGPASDVVFNAVRTEESAGGVVEIAPKNDGEWAVVRNKALIMTEVGNLLMIRRRIADGGASGPATPGGGQTELTPKQIEARLAKDRKTWDALAKGLIAAASVAVKAAEMKDPAALSAAGEGIDAACESCHLSYWYPGQQQLLDKADQALRQRKL